MKIPIMIVWLITVEIPQWLKNYVDAPFDSEEDTKIRVSAVWHYRLYFDTIYLSMYLSIYLSAMYIVPF